MSKPVAPWRRRVNDWVHSSQVQNIVMAVIILNSITIGVETAVDHSSTAYQVLHLLDLLALGVFIVEIAVKLVAMGPRAFFSRGWNIFDFLVVVIALAPGAGPLSVLRTLRVLRLLRVIKFMPSLRRVVEALLRSLPGISAIGVLIGMVFYVAAVMATVMFGSDFPQWFGSLGASFYTLFQMMTLDSWSTGIVRPIMEASPWAWLFFVPFILVAAFTMLNLFIAVIVDTMSNLTPSEQEGDATPQEPPAHEATNAAILAEVRALRAELATLRGHTADVHANQSQVSDGSVTADS